MDAIERLRVECGGCLDCLGRASLVGLLLAFDEARGVLRERIAAALAGYGR